MLNFKRESWQTSPAPCAVCPVCPTGDFSPPREFRPYRSFNRGSSSFSLSFAEAHIWRLAGIGLVFEWRIDFHNVGLVWKCSEVKRVGHTKEGERAFLRFYLRSLLHNLRAGLRKSVNLCTTHRFEMERLKVYREALEDIVLAFLTDVTSYK